ncbi:UMP-CMP kinase-like [Coccinella septempunctata]|uniref:UMP-CMP kinase-like n=1 Tax=Coccinella septempunctata TaxID=41139 RepID=UPI001D06360D|nr:UMP-CMP kinase-like [Coccinella septempunctata]XP_044749109.1 UMP-CMP kinase-like [Coccinella septempunctata]
MGTKVLKPKVIFVLGPPGSGKGTQCVRLASEFNYVHLSAGELLRQEKSKPDSKYRKLIDTYMKEGKLVPVAISCGLLKKAMFESQRDKFLIDGFPRNKDNVDGWNKDVAGYVDLQFVLFFDCPLEICIKRCLKRGAETGRDDDNEESLRKRIKTYISESSPIIQHYNMLKLVHAVDASKEPDDVYKDVKNLMLKYNPKSCYFILFQF